MIRRYFPEAPPQLPDNLCWLLDRRILLILPGKSILPPQSEDFFHRCESDKPRQNYRDFALMVSSEFPLRRHSSAGEIYNGLS